MSPPLTAKFIQTQTMQDGSCQNIENQVTIHQVDQMYETTQRIKGAVDFIQKNALNEGFQELNKLQNENKVKFTCIPMQ